MIFDLLIQSFKEAFKISAFVIMIMMIMEFASLLFKGKNNNFLSKYPSQLLFALLMGLIPGCVGGFTVVSMYSHGLLSFGALLGATFTALGDDVFRMFSMMPSLVFQISLILLILGLVFAILVDRIPFFKKINLPSANHIELHSEQVSTNNHHLHHHSHHQISCIQPCSPFSSEIYKNWSFLKTILLFVIVLYIVGLLSGQLTHTHSLEHLNCHHGHGFEFNFENISLLFIGLLGFLIIWISEEHFLEEHLWKHTLKKHFLSIFLWTLGTLFFVGLLTQYLDIAQILSKDLNKLFFLLLLAIAVGWIPQSGPHFVFILFFFNGWIPFSILLANSIVQDGHTSLVLLAESRRSFIWIKGIKSVIAFVVGLIMLLI